MRDTEKRFCEGKREMGRSWSEMWKIEQIYMLMEIIQKRK
jgi:hypothetical protein